VKRQVSLKGSCSCREDTRYYLSLKMLLSFKVIRIYIVDWSVYNTISYSYSFVRVKNYVTCIVSSRYSTSNNGVSLNSGLGSHSMSLEMALFDRLHVSSYFLFVFHCNDGPILYRFRSKARQWSKIVIPSYPLLDNN